MKLDENYYLENSEQQWTLKFSSTNFDDKKQKDVTTSREYYFNSLSHALNSYLDKKLKAAETVDVAVRMLYSNLCELKEKGFTLKK